MDHAASKSWTRADGAWQKQSYSAGFEFAALEMPVANLRGLASLIDELRCKPDAFVVRGGLTATARAQIEADPIARIRRIKRAQGNGDQPTIEDAARSWLMADIDDYPLGGVDPASAVDAAVRDLLPAEFHTADYFWQLSASAGFTPDVLKVHVWFWLERPIRCAELRPLMGAVAPAVDPALFDPIQVHYTADPIVVGGADPIPTRTGWHDGAQEAVSLPPMPSRPVLMNGTTDARTDTASPMAGSTGTAVSINQLGDGDGLAGFHAPIRAESVRYARRCADTGTRDDAGWIARMQAAIASAPKRPDRDTSLYADPRHLQRLIDSAVARITTDDAARPDADDGAAAAPPPSPMKLPKGFSMGDKGLFYAEEGKDAVWVAAPFQVLGTSDDGAGNGWGIVLRWRDPAGNSHDWIVSRAQLHGEPRQIAGFLDAQGLRCGVSAAAHAALVRFLATVQTDKRLTAVRTAGWHQGAFVLGDGTVIGSDADVILQPELVTCDAALASAGSLADWQSAVAAPARGNSRLVLFLSAAFAGCLLDLASEQSGGFHLVGKSRSGKSSSAFMAGSVWGKGDTGGAVRQWRATANGLEAASARANDGVLILDELSQVDAREAGDAIYTIANGQGKTRANTSGGARQTANWRLLFLSTGEVSLAHRMAEAGRRTLTGMETRLVNIPTDAGAGMGTFEQLHGETDPARFADRLREAARTHHGTAGRAFLTSLAAAVARDRDGTRRMLTVLREQFIADHVPAGADGQVKSVAGRFGVVAAAGELATEWGVVPWQTGEATDAAAACFRAWLAERGTAGAGEDEAAIQQVRAFIETHGTSRFAIISGAALIDNHTVNRAGWRKRDAANDRWDYFILPEAWKNEVCKGIDWKRAARALAERGWLQHDGAHLATKVTIPEAGRVRVYGVCGAILTGDDVEQTEPAPIAPAQPAIEHVPPPADYIESPALKAAKALPGPDPIPMKPVAVKSISYPVPPGLEARMKRLVGEMQYDTEHGPYGSW